MYAVDVTLGQFREQGAIVQQVVLHLNAEEIRLGDVVIPHLDHLIIGGRLDILIIALAYAKIGDLICHLGGQFRHTLLGKVVLALGDEGAIMLIWPSLGSGVVRIVVSILRRSEITSETIVGYKVLEFGEEGIPKDSLEVYFLRLGD